MEETYDIIIVGCGMAGALAGLAALQEDLTVCIVERKQREFIGKKICGELIPQEICEWLKNDFAFTIEYYPLKGLRICSSYETIHAESALHIEEPLCTIDRWKFGQILVDELLKRGAHLKHETVRVPVYETCVKGVKTEDSALMAGYSAGKVAARAVRNSDTSMRGMWQYNRECARRYGAIFGPLFVLRDFLLSLSQKELTFLLERLITSEELAQLEKHWSAPSLKRMLTVFLTNWRNLSLLHKLYTVLKRMMEVRYHYECYPEDPERFLQWRQGLDSLFQ